jgi:anti-sigma-K factor RskA
VPNSHANEDIDLIAALLVRAGAIMEDESVALVSRIPDDDETLNARVARFEEVAADFAALAAAAKTLLRISCRQP